MFALLCFLEKTAIRFRKIEQHSQRDILVPPALCLDEDNKFCCLSRLDEKTKIVIDIVYENGLKSLNMNVINGYGRVLGVKLFIEGVYIFYVLKKRSKHAVSGLLLDSSVICHVSHCQIPLFLVLLYHFLLLL